MKTLSERIQFKDLNKFKKNIKQLLHTVNIAKIASLDILEQKKMQTKTGHYKCIFFLQTQFQVDK